MGLKSMRDVLLEIRVAHAPGAACYLDLLWLRYSGRDAASANQAPRTPTHARTGKPRKHKQGLRAEPAASACLTRYCKKTPPLRAPV
jgi:hypothetical protein